MKITNSIIHTVHDVLARDPKSRNSDQRLVVMVWATLHPHRIFTAPDGNGTPTQCFSLKDMAESFEHFESIRRVRQTLTNDLGLYPASKTVKNGRRKNQQIMEDWKKNQFTPQQTKAIVTMYTNCPKKSTFDLKKIIQQLQ